MTAPRERSAGRAPIANDARDRSRSALPAVAGNGSDRRLPQAYATVDEHVENLDAFESAIVFAMRRAAAVRRARLRVVGVED